MPDFRVLYRNGNLAYLKTKLRQRNRKSGISKERAILLF